MRMHDVQESREFTFGKISTALIVYDMQVGILHQITNAAEVTAQVRLVLETARKAGLRTFFTRHMSLP
jgi:nicotinamidase-related amidase